MKKNDNPPKHKQTVGGLVGRSVGGRIENCHVKGKITINGNPDNCNVGGLVGSSEDTKILNSSADVKVEFAGQTPQTEPIIELKPNFYGLGINLRALWKKVTGLFHRTSK
jgi:hypothetical protein